MKTKVCTKCKQEKIISEFSFKDKLKGYLHSACKECYKIVKKNSYNKKKDYYLAKSKERKDKLKEYYIEFKKQKCCEICGENHIACLEFHHTNNDKINNVSDFVRQGHSIENIMKEIKKCQILCSNCHRKLHYLSN